MTSLPIVIGGCLLLLVGMIGLLWRVNATATGKLLARVDVIEQQLSLVTQSVIPISQAFQQVLIAELTHFHEPRTDLLLAKLGPPFTLSDDEEEELLTALKEREKDMGDQITPSERDAARMLPLVIKRVKMEVAGLSTPPTMLQLISLASAAKAPEAVAPPVAPDAAAPASTDGAAATPPPK